jgi:hypothetical protein
VQDRKRDRSVGAGPKRGPREPAVRDGTPAALTDLIGLLDRAVKVVPAAGYFWGIIAASVTVAIISRLNGLNRLTFVAMLAAFVAMFIFYVFSRMERSNDVVVKLVGRALLIVSGLAFIFVIVTSAWLALSCSPRLIAYLYGVAEVCYGPATAATLEKKAIYRSFVRRDGIWEGVDQIAPEEANHLNRSYEFTLIGDPGRPAEVRVKNGSGACSVDGLSSVTGDSFGGECSNARACTAKLRYKQDGTMDREMVYDQFDNLPEQIEYPTPSVGEFVDAAFPCDHGRSGIRLIQFERVKSGPNKGLDEVVRFLDKDRHPRPNDARNYGWRLQYDADHHVTGVTKIGPHGENWNVDNGFATTRSTYNEKGLESSRSFFSPEDRPTSDNSGVARQQLAYDLWGNLVAIEYFDNSGKATLNKDGLYKEQNKFDERGNKIQADFFGVDGQPILSKDGYARWQSKFDERGNAIERAYFGTDRKPILNKYAISVKRSKFDQYDNEIETAYFGTNGDPVYQKDIDDHWQDAVHLTKYDGRGNTVEDTSLGADRRPSPGSHSGVVTTRNVFSLTNKRLTAAFFDGEGRPVAWKEDKAGWNSKFDERGNEVEEAFFGVEGFPIINKHDGVSGWRTKYDEFGNAVEVAYFGLAGKPILNRDGYARRQSKFDERGNGIEDAYFGVDGQPILHKDGNAVARFKYDDRGNNLEMAYFGVDGRPILGKGGYATVKFKYDQGGNVIEATTFDVAGLLIRSGSVERDSRGNGIKKNFFGSDGRPERVAGLRSKFDARGNEIETAYFGLDDKPILSEDGYAGWQTEFDARGNKSALTYFGMDRKPILSKDGYATWRSKFDEQDNVVETAYFDTQGRPVLSKEGYAVSRTKLDERGNSVEIAYFDVNNKPIARNDAVAVVVNECDSANRTIARHFLNTQRKAVRALDTGRSIIRWSYDDHNLPVQESSFDELDQPVDRADENWSVKQWLYDANGQLEKIVLRDKSGHEILPPSSD